MISNFYTGSKTSNGRRKNNRLGRAVFATVEPLERRVLMSTTVEVAFNTDSDATYVAPSGSPLMAHTLRDAVTYADDATGSVGDVTITFAGTITSITLNGTLGALRLSNGSYPTTISGPGANVLSISGGGSTTVFNVTSVATATISGLTITDGNAGSSDGGGILNQGDLTVTACAVTQCTAADGGGIASESGTLFLANDDELIHSGLLVRFVNHGEIK